MKWNSQMTIYIFSHSRYCSQHKFDISDIFYIDMFKKMSEKVNLPTVGIELTTLTIHGLEL